MEKNLTLRCVYFCTSNFHVCKKTIYNILQKYGKKTPTELKKEYNKEPKNGVCKVKFNKPTCIDESGVEENEIKELKISIVLPYNNNELILKPVRV